MFFVRIARRIKGYSSDDEGWTGRNKSLGVAFSPAHAMHGNGIHLNIYDFVSNYFTFIQPVIIEGLYLAIPPPEETKLYALFNGIHWKEPY